MFFDACTDANGKADWQVRIYYADAGEETLLKPPERSRWARRILARTRLPAGSERIDVAATKEPRSPPHRTGMMTALEVIDLRLHKPMDHLHPHPLTEISFKLSGAAAEALTLQQLPYRIEFYAVDLERRGAFTLLASKCGQLEPRVLEYTDTQALPMPALGHYELHSLVRLLPPCDAFARQRGPLINVVP